MKIIILSQIGNINWINKKGGCLVFSFLPPYICPANWKVSPEHRRPVQAAPWMRHGAGPSRREYLRLQEVISALRAMISSQFILLGCVFSY